jgi:NNP family nitrate/nitrite transporter-like MFS transporter
VSLLWMHFRHPRWRRGRGETLAKLPGFAGDAGLHRPAWPEPPRHRPTGGRRTRLLGGARAARSPTRNLWISIPALLLAFAVWMVWSVVVAKLPSVGFKFTTDQLFWLAALPGLSGATLRIFYSFMVPIFGGRLWTTLSPGR